MWLVFNNTGDTIELEPNKKVFEYFEVYMCYQLILIRARGHSVLLVDLLLRNQAPQKAGL